MLATPWGIVTIVESKDANGRTTALELRCPRGMEGEAILRLGAESKEARIKAEDTTSRLATRTVTLDSARDDDGLGYVAVGWGAPMKSDGAR